ncbi:hypothetical protein B566_EDAN013434 [Ephemera danica]|nr:hypothetical protein B566_EDAN013434 [Ephemera danica]
MLARQCLVFLEAACISLLVMFLGLLRLAELSSYRYFHYKTRQSDVETVQGLSIAVILIGTVWTLIQVCWTCSEASEYKLHQRFRSWNIIFSVVLIVLQIFLCSRDYHTGSIKTKPIGDITLFIIGYQVIKLPFQLRVWCTQPKVIKKRRNSDEEIVLPI